MTDPRDLLANATSRPWLWQECKPDRLGVSVPLIRTVDDQPESWQAVAELGFDAPEANADLIVAAVNEYEALLDIADAAREGIDYWAAQPETVYTEAIPGVGRRIRLAKALARLDALRSGRSVGDE